MDAVCNHDCFNCPHPDCILDRLTAHAYYEANKDKIAAKNRAYYEANREELAAKHRAYMREYRINYKRKRR